MFHFVALGGGFTLAGGNRLMDLSIYLPLGLYLYTGLNPVHCTVHRRVRFCIVCTRLDCVQSFPAKSNYTFLIAIAG